MKTAGVSSIKNSLPACPKAVTAGESFLANKRNKSVAILQPLYQTENRGTGISRLSARGLVSPGKRKLALASFLRKPRGRAGTLPFCNDPERFRQE
jgi:antitoxin (DNA-binding transcriptional repressor) of toxin-antitoxin stability system